MDLTSFASSCHQEEFGSLLGPLENFNKRSLTDLLSLPPTKRKRLSSLPVANGLDTDTALPPVTSALPAEEPTSNVTSPPDACASEPAQSSPPQHVVASVTSPPTARKLDLDNPVLDTKPSPSASTDAPVSSTADLPSRYVERIRYLAELVPTPFPYLPQDARVDAAVQHVRVVYHDHLEEVGESLATEMGRHKKRVAEEMASHEARVATITKKADAKFAKSLDSHILPALRGISVVPVAPSRSLSR